MQFFEDRPEAEPLVEFITEAESKLRKAWSRRKEILTAFSGNTNTWRWVHSSADGFLGVTVDVLDSTLLVEQHREDASVDELLKVLGGLPAQNPVFLKKRWSPEPAMRCGAQVSGTPASPVFQILENGLRFGVRLTDEEHIGWFLDSRLPREWVRANSLGKRVLNLFSYTGGFGVYGAAGGAKSTVNIDNKQSALHFAQQNYQRNGLPFDNRTFFKCDVLYFLKRASGQKGRFDLIVVDPPPRFKRHRQRDFEAHVDYHRLLAGCIDILEPGGCILAGLNALRADDSVFDNMMDVAAAATSTRITVETELNAHGDFPPSPDRPVSRFRVLRVESVSN